MKQESPLVHVLHRNEARQYDWGLDNASIDGSAASFWIIGGGALIALITIAMMRFGGGQPAGSLALEGSTS